MISTVIVLTDIYGPVRLIQNESIYVTNMMYITKCDVHDQLFNGWFDWENGKVTRIGRALTGCSISSLLFSEALLSIPPDRQKTWNRLSYVTKQHNINDFLNLFERNYK
jgi:hypothetical protein